MNGNRFQLRTWRLGEIRAVHFLFSFDPNWKRKFRLYPKKKLNIRKKFTYVVVLGARRYFGEQSFGTSGRKERKKKEVKKSLQDLHINAVNFPHVLKTRQRLNFSHGKRNEYILFAYSMETVWKLPIFDNLTLKQLYSQLSHLILYNIQFRCI